MTNLNNTEQNEKFINEPSKPKNNKKKKNKTNTDNSQLAQSKSNNQIKPKKNSNIAMLAKQLKEQKERDEAFQIELERISKEEEAEEQRLYELEQAQQAIKLEQKKHSKKDKLDDENHKIQQRKNALIKLGVNPVNLSNITTTKNKFHNKKQPIITTPIKKSKSLINNQIIHNENENKHVDDWEHEYTEDIIDDTVNKIVDDIKINNDYIDVIEDVEDVEDVEDETNGNVEVKMKAPICCILGNVDVGKTTFIDRVGSTKVQQNEAGGITQTINTVLIPFKKNVFNIPGVILIDTPGHDSFYNLRTFGVSLCNFVILMIDIMDGVKEQTIKSIQLIKSNKIPYIVVLNKLDRINMWNSDYKLTVNKNLKKQKPESMGHFEDLVSNVITQFAENGLNVALHFRNNNPATYASIFPVSAHTREGINELFAGLMNLVTKYIKKDIIWSDNFEAITTDTTLEKGFGKCTNILLYNGMINKKDHIVMTTLNGPVTKQISKLGLIDDGRFRVVDEAYATGTIKIAMKGDDVDKPLIGSPIYQLSHKLDKSEYTAKISEYNNNINQYLKSKEEELSKNTSNHGVLVCASSFGGLTAITEYLESKNIPYIDAKIGIVKTQDIHKILNFNKTTEDKVYNIIICFNTIMDIRATQEIKKYPQIEVISNDIIYRIFENIDKTIETKLKELQSEYEKTISHPVILELLNDHIYRRKNPIIVGIEVLDGTLKVGTVIQCLKKNINKYQTSEDIVIIGTINNIQNPEGKDVDEVKTGNRATIQIINDEDSKLVGRDFGPASKEEIITTHLWSVITEDSYYLMKKHFYDNMNIQWKNAFHKLSVIYRFES